jgi:hypothetical protein
LELSPIRDVYSEISSEAAVFRNSPVAQLLDFLGEGGSARKYYAVLEQLSWRRDSNQMLPTNLGRFSNFSMKSFECAIALDLGIVVHGLALFLLSSFLWGSLAVKRKLRLAVAHRPNR